MLNVDYLFLYAFINFKFQLTHCKMQIPALKYYAKQNVNVGIKTMERYFQLQMILFKKKDRFGHFGTLFVTGEYHKKQF